MTDNEEKRDYRKVSATIAAGELVAKYGHLVEDLQDHTRKQLIVLLKEAEKEVRGIEDIDLDNVELENAILDDTTVVSSEETYLVGDQGYLGVQEKHKSPHVEIEIVTPKITDPEWHDYVMDQFLEDELKEGNPTTDGLRRVAELCVGEITGIKSEVCQVPNQENQGRATVKVVVSFFHKTKSGDYVYTDYHGCADVFHGNTDEPYCMFPVATAETRAEGRALKRALRLRKVVAAEEMAKNVKYDNPWNPMNVIPNDDPDQITENQINFLELMCDSNKLNLDLQKFIEYTASKLGWKNFNCKNVKEIRHEQFFELKEELSGHQRDIENIPEEIKGYNSGWRSTFG